jgi:uncharacterized phage protein (predicted DNA packaging)
MLLTIEEAKKYLRLDNTEEDTLIQTLMYTSEELCQDIARVDFSEVVEIPEVIKIAILYGVTYLYENREQADFKELTETLKCLLFGIRKEMF